MRAEQTQIEQIMNLPGHRGVVRWWRYERSPFRSGVAGTYVVGASTLPRGIKPGGATAGCPANALLHRNTNGYVSDIDTSGSHVRLSSAGAPKAAAAGLECRVRVDDRVERGQPLFTLHA